MAASRFDSGAENYIIQKYNQNEYEMELYLDNTGTMDKENRKRFFINPAAILGLSIVDTVTNWSASGSLSFMYIPEKVDQSEAANTGQNANTAVKGAIENGKMLSHYQFRGDGYDLLRVMIAPKFAVKDKASSDAAIEATKDNPEWVLSYLFSIYDIQDVHDIPELKGPTAPYLKCLKLSFHDVRYQMLKTTNIEYSTADKSTTPDRKILTSTAMADIINQSIGDEEKGGCEEFKVVDQPPDWDTAKSQIFYTSPAAYSALDDLEYIYANNVSNTEVKGNPELILNDLALLHTNRPKAYNELEPIVLTPLSQFFEKAGKGENEPGELQKEHLFLTAHTSEENETGMLTRRAPMGGNDKTIDVKTFKFGQIISYGLVDMSPDFNSNTFRTTPVYSVDIGKRVFNVQFKGNDVDNAKNIIAGTYIEQLYKAGTSKDLFLPVIHKTKKDLNVFPTFSLNGDDDANGLLLRQKNAFHVLLYSGLFQNTCITFKTMGCSLRESGTFIGIDRTQGCQNNDYNNKLFGQWFVVKVEHIFEAGAYLNRIYAIKIHRHDKLIDDFDGRLIA